MLDVKSYLPGNPLRTVDVPTVSIAAVVAGMATECRSFYYEPMPEGGVIKVDPEHAPGLDRLLKNAAIAESRAAEWQTYCCYSTGGAELGIALYVGEDTMLDLALPKKSADDAAVVLPRLEAICATLNAARASNDAAFPLTDDDKRYGGEKAVEGHGNAREQLSACAEWLGCQDETLSAGLRSPEDGLKLWRFFQSRPASLPEVADEDEDGYDVAGARVAALGYDPMSWTPPGD